MDNNQGGKKDRYAYESEKNIHTDFKDNMTYGDYLQLDHILNSQKRMSDHHDEMLFIIIHQVSELWMKLIIHEIRAAIDSIEEGDLQTAFKMLARVTKVQSQIIHPGMSFLR
ncbi:tryptophan 2,3-dioxygenase [Evansella vedderi]|uniref:Tryptophan 2,3-dioxygenase n=1 Tax=Evansella vedderi TaxID=38282 RepID=A0ABT9ZV20_9BACI|nr:tryptophan 2,3-dioxygenase [Evansella vedderi]